jgi:hypothetical protein
LEATGFEEELLLLKIPVLPGASFGRVRTRIAGPALDKKI